MVVVVVVVVQLQTIANLGNYSDPENYPDHKQLSEYS